MDNHFVSSPSAWVSVSEALQTITSSFVAYVVTFRMHWHGRYGKIGGLEDFMINKKKKKKRTPDTTLRLKKSG